ncbi:MAG: Fe-S protein assembly co-chaperone HscB [Holosporaceae bacterium]|jgi:molecular chaperone HscB|nr:Fe-S protein assembly co-chaperone HscB [Holosporaceae bacterium]
MNYFEFLEIPVSYYLDESQLLQVYLQKQSRLHPDANDHSSNQSGSALLNAAYKTLLDPLKRAEHFLQVKNVNVEEAFPDVVMKTFEWQESYSALTSLKGKKAFQENLKNQMQVMLESLGKNEGNIEKFSKILSQLRFVSSFLEKISDDVYSGD